MALAVYSVNVVGYVNKTLNPGYSLIANPFNTAAGTASSINALLPSPPPGTVVFTFDTGIQNFVGNSFDEFALAWSDPAMQLNLGSGFFINIPAGNPPYVLTFVGEVATGNVANNPNNAFSIRSSKVPQAGAVSTVLGLQPGPGDVLFKFNTTIQNFEGYSYDEFALTWGPSEPVVDVAEAFFYNNVSTTAAWPRTFTIP
jgi:hypothetical protein